MAANSGGRVRYEVGTQVRILMLDGKISRETYKVDRTRSDRKGHVVVLDRLGRSVKVHHRRVLRTEAQNDACVIEASGKCWAVCPRCGHAEPFDDPGSTDHRCPNCDRSFKCHWLGEKPMATVAKKTTKQHHGQSQPKPTATKASKALAKPSRVDLPALAKLASCELWTKSQIKFDHARIDVKAHVLLCVGTHPRKLCFNTYDGSLGKKSPELPIAAFVANKAPKGAHTPWFAVTDLEKTRQKLIKADYAKA